MKRSLITVALAALAMSVAIGQQSGTKSVFENESDSIAGVRMNLAAKELGLNARQAQRLARLYSGQYEELCRGLQMSIMQQRMKEEAGMEDSEAEAQAKADFDGTCRKYEQRYIRELGEELFGKWRELKSIDLDSQYDSLIEHVKANTENYF